MKLFITRDQEQKKGLFGSGTIKFELNARVELTNEEKQFKKWMGGEINGII